MGYLRQMTEKLLVDMVGWVGSIEVVLAYALNSSQKLNAKSIWYQFLNLTGALFLIINTYYYQAYPSTFINLVWVVIAILALIRRK
ncbi:MAG: hypothetical protein KI790_01455 [Cyclobacteriaceae bacterium]|nr:hypothetical protein [Cyclobacteriaceae bacterium HetDA_MAG_MS6]